MLSLTESKPQYPHHKQIFINYCCQFLLFLLHILLNLAKSLSRVLSKSFTRLSLTC